MYSRLLFIACMVLLVVAAPFTRTAAHISVSSPVEHSVVENTVSKELAAVNLSSVPIDSHVGAGSNAVSSSVTKIYIPAPVTVTAAKVPGARSTVAVANNQRHNVHKIPATFPVVPRSAATLKNWVQGIYITQNTLENTQRIQSLIEQSKAVGINTFVIDLWGQSRRYRENIELVKQSGIKYVARIVVFPDGGNGEQILSKAHWEKKYKLVEQAVALGAQEIQLDYIRYNTRQRPSEQNARNIYEVIKWFKEKLLVHNISLQIDVFGITSFGDSLYIGQDLPLFSKSADAICPMVYPSHYEPYQKYVKMPYYIIRYSLNSLREQFNGKPPFRLYPFIETYNYRYPLSEQEKLTYIDRQIAAVEDSGADGWYVWNPFNEYHNLFTVLRLRQGQGIKVAETQPSAENEMR